MLVSPIASVPRSPHTHLHNRNNSSSTSINSHFFLQNQQQFSRIQIPTLSKHCNKFALPWPRTDVTGLRWRLGELHSSRYRTTAQHALRRLDWIGEGLVKDW